MCAETVVIIHLLDQAADVQRQVRCKVESQAAGERGVSARSREKKKGMRRHHVSVFAGI